MSLLSNLIKDMVFFLLGQEVFDMQILIRFIVSSVGWVLEGAKLDTVMRFL